MSNRNKELKIHIGMHRHVNALDRKTAAIAASHKLTLSQFAVLEALYSKGDMSVGAVRDRILSSVGTIPLIVNNLVKRQFIERLPDPNDRRVCLLHLTERGRQVIGELLPVNTQMIQTYMSPLDSDEQATLLHLLRKLGGIQDGTKNS